LRWLIDLLLMMRIKITVDAGKQLNWINGQSYRFNAKLKM
jgi:hypothetical protein